MGKKKQKPSYKDRQFFALPHAIMRSKEWIELSHRAVRLLIDFGEQLNGNNNGDLHCAWSLMKKRGWKSQDQLVKARDELIKKGWIILTRKGSRNIAHLFAISFRGIDECFYKKGPMRGQLKFDDNKGIKPSREALDTWKKN